MTREEAKTWLNKLYARADITDEYGDMEDMQPYEEAVNMAIKALEQEPCDDAVSRQAAIDTIESWLSCDDYNEAERHIMRAMQSVLYDLPSVRPQEPCDDAVSREDALKLIYDFKERHTEDREKHPINYGTLLDLIRLIRELPPVRPQEQTDTWSIKDISDTFKKHGLIREQEPKTGHWKAIENEEMDTVGYYCSECDLPMETEEQTDFCPNCGARMVGPQESEDKG